MAKFNEKKVAKQPTETNFMGEMAFKMEDKEELVSTVMTTFLHNEYYEKESDKVSRIQSLLKKVDPLFAARLAIYARNEGNLRSVTHLVSAEIAKYIGGSEWAKRFYNKIVVRPDDMSEIVSAYAQINGMKQNDIKKIPNAIKRGFKAVLERLDAYQLDKYKMNNRSVSMIDLIRLFHPKGTQKNAEAFKRLVNGESLDDLYETKILEKQMTKAGKDTKDSTIEEKNAAKAEAISEVLDNVKGMPIMNLIRNLRNIILYAPNKVDDACAQLRFEKKILNSRLLPFRFATAYSEIEKMAYDESKKADTDITFESDIKSNELTKEQFDECKGKVLDALEDALQYSVNNIPELEGNVAVLIDHSGSVRGDGGGSSRVSAFSKTNTAMIGNLFGSMMAYRQKNVYVGLFGDRLINAPMKRDMKLLDFNEYSYREGAKCGGGTETGIYDFIEKCVKENKKVDNVVVFSDCQIGNGYSFTPWYGHSSSQNGKHFHELFKKFRKINPSCNWIVVNLRQSGSTSVFDKSQRILNIAGWSDKIFDVIKSQCKGWDAIIKEIEAIEI
jgi:60 kDa SS-A/Ro ribonucleoprotein